MLSKKIALQSFEGSSGCIAIVGIGCRFPGNIANPKDYWDTLINKKSHINTIPEDRWNSSRFFDQSSLRTDRMITKYGAFLSDISHFDAKFFGILPREAEAMDPQQRLFLEVSYEALEDASLNPTNLEGKNVGVFVGVSSRDYWDLQQRSSISDMYTNAGKALSIIPNRLSYSFNFTGPSLAVDTACSSSLCALHLAFNSLISGESCLAVVGGANLVINPNLSIGFSQSGILSPDSVLRPFDSSGKGYIRSEGIGSIVLMPLEEALSQKIDIYALVKGTKINQDGKTPSLSHPNLESQELLIRSLYQELEVDFRDVDYVEAHGTGTAVGDRTELLALSNVLGKNRRQTPLPIGSVKGNLGHMEAASGIGGLIKLALCLKHKKWVPSLNFSHPPEGMHLDSMGLEILQTVRDWKEQEGKVIAGINSFGFGGTNVHAVLQNIDSSVLSTFSVNSLQKTQLFAFPVTAQTIQSLGARLKQIATFLSQTEGKTDISLTDLSYTLCFRQKHHTYRALIFANTHNELRDQLNNLVTNLDKIEKQKKEFEKTQTLKSHPFVDSKKTFNTSASDFKPSNFSYEEFLNEEHNLIGKFDGQPKKVSFICSGQGGEWSDIGKTLFEHCDEARQVINEFDAFFQSLSGWSVKEFLISPPDHLQTQLIQPLIFAIQIGLAAWWKSIGINPDSIVGHSVGEVAAAYIAGVYDLKDATSIIFHRSHLQAQTGTDHGLLAVKTTEEILEKKVWASSENSDICLAAKNGPESLVIAGPLVKLKSLVNTFSQAKIASRILNLAQGFHSPQMDQIRDDLIQKLDPIKPKKAKIKLYSTVTGSMSCGESWDSLYWWKNVRQTVQFDQALKAIQNDTNEKIIWIELGMKSLFRNLILKERSDVYLFLSTKESKLNFHPLVSQLFKLGTHMNWDKWTSYGLPLKLPSYPWEKKSYWQEPFSSVKHRTSLVSHPWLSMLETGETEWIIQVSTRSHPLLADHRIGEQVIFPGAAYIDLALGLPLFSPDSPKLIENLEFHQPYRVSTDINNSLLKLSYDVFQKKFTVSSYVKDQRYPNVHCIGTLKEIKNLSPPEVVCLQDLIKTFTPVDLFGIYKDFSKFDLNYGPMFQGLKDGYSKPLESIAKVEFPDWKEESFGQFPFHPSFLDSAFQATFLTLDRTILSEGEIQLWPKSICSCEFYRQPTKSCWVWAKQKYLTSTSFQADLWIYDSTGNPIAKLKGLTFALFSSPSFNKSKSFVYSEEWKPIFPEFKPVKKKKILISTNKEQLKETCKILFANENNLLFESLSDQDIDLDTIVFHSSNDKMLRSPEQSTEAMPLLLELVQKLEKNPTKNHLELVLITQKARQIVHKERIENPGQALFWGFGRVLKNEFPHMEIRLIDIDRLTANSLKKILEYQGPEKELGIRQNNFFAPRVKDLGYSVLTPKILYKRVDPKKSRFFLQKSKNKVFESVFLLADDRVPPKEKEVEVKIKSAALNFRDIMKILGTYPTENPLDDFLGDECSGIISRVGSQSVFKEGDRVIALSPKAIGSFLTCSEQFVFPIPTSLSDESAAGFSISTLTAYYSLIRLAHLQAGETILIHSAAGGVGLAAIQIAKMAGAKIIATAGSPKKRQYLSDLGVDYVFDSRRLDFEDQIRTLTIGKGVDVVLNSISGDALDRSLSLLAPFGRFIEIGKADIYQNTSLRLGRFKKNASFYSVDLTELLFQKSELASQLMKEILTLLSEGKIQPPLTQSFSLPEVVKALRFMAKSEHMGKVVINIPETPVKVKKAQTALKRIKPNATYIITGGYSGVGFQTAKWLVENGAKTLVLLGKSGHVSEEVLSEIKRLRDKGICIEVFSCDVCQKFEVQELLKKIRSLYPPIHGIFHAAMVIDDGLISDLTPSRFLSVLSPKVQGSWNLHIQTLRDPLDYFVLFSSISGVIGNPGQANYASANLFLDALSDFRQSRGLPALSVSWGAFGEVGYLSRHQKAKHYLNEMGLQDLNPKKALEFLSYWINHKKTNVIIADIQWEKLSSRLTSLKEHPRFSNLYNLFFTQSAFAFDFLNHIKNLRPEEQKKAVQERLSKIVSQVLNVHPSSIDIKISLHQLGLDSLGALELKNQIFNELKIDLSARDFSEHPSISNLTEIALRVANYSQKSQKIEAV